MTKTSVHGLCRLLKANFEAACGLPTWLLTDLLGRVGLDEIQGRDGGLLECQADGAGSIWGVEMQTRRLQRVA